MLIFEILLAIENEEERTLVEGIYLDYYGRMIQICHQILRHPQDSEDAAMNAMKRIAENSKNFREKTVTKLFLSWLYIQETPH